MSARCSKAFYLSFSAVILLLAIALLLLPSRPFVSLRFCGFETNRYETFFDTNEWKRVSAIIEVTNCSRQAVSYRAYHKSEYAEYTSLYFVGGCWTNFDIGFRCGTGALLAQKSGWTWRQFTLEPSQAFVFKAGVLRPNTPCTVVIAYHPVRSTNAIYRVLPSWLVQRLPWRRGVYYAATDPF